MALSVTCPRCASKYQLDAAMRGKRMRCPNTICRAIFEVRDDNDPPAVETKPAETASPPVAETPTDNPAPAVISKPVEEKPPPIVAKPVEPKKPEPVKPKAVPRPVEPPPEADFPDDFPGDEEAAAAPTAPAIATEAWQPEVQPAPLVQEEPAPLPVTFAKPTPPRVKRRRALWVIAAMFLALAAVVGVIFWQIRGGIASNEAERFQKAEEYYKEHQFADASAAFQKLHQDFPDSVQGKKYRFLAELSDVRQAVLSRDELDKALGRVQWFASTYADDPLLKERREDLWQTLDFLATELARLAERDKAPNLLALSRSAWAEAKKYPPPAGMSQTERRLADEWKRVEQVLAVHFEREFVLAMLKKYLDVANAFSVQDAAALVERTKRQDDPEIRALMNDLVKAHRAQVKFVPANPDVKPQLHADDALPSLSVTPSLKAERPIAGTHPLVLALARGVLYALDPANGEVRWVRRVGIDTTVLPLRVPADASTPELLLMPSSDQRSLSALVADTGAVHWQTPLSDACLGELVLIDRHVLAATLAGRVDEIDIAKGQRLGSYHMGQPLTLGGVRQPGTAMVTFPADEFCVYVLDAAKRTCPTILYTKHPPGSLRGLPAILPADKGALLIWTQATGAERVEIKPFELPILRHDAKPVEPILQMPGLSAPPWRMEDRLAVVTDTGMMSLWGVRQKGTRDPLLFSLMKRDFPLETGKPPGRCQVVHADAENYWSLTYGRLQRVRATFDPKEGPGLMTGSWPQPIALGNLLHAAQARREPDGRTILFPTTQADAHPTCLCSAVDADDGKIIWQRQLGVLPRQTPHVLGGQIVLRDAHGLVRFDPATPNDKPWQPAGAWLHQEPWTDARRILLARDSSYVQLTSPRGKAKLQMRVGSISGDAKIHEFDVAPLQGTPAFGDKFVLLPLADGTLAQCNLDGTLLKDVGFNWRADGAVEQAAGHAVLLSQTECVLTDGARGLALLVSSDGKSWIKRAAKDKELRQLPHRITAAPVILPAEGNARARLCVADASDTLTLLDADLSLLQSWSMPGKITAGPFVRAGKIGCVVGRSQLVWIDPEQKEIAWQYRFADIVGEPNLIEGALVVADVAGRFVALDPSSGRPFGPELTLHANVAATAAPLPFGAGRAFVPLTDGTVVILPLKNLRAAK